MGVPFLVRKLFVYNGFGVLLVAVLENFFVLA